jgi:hypothetical protein
MKVICIKDDYATFDPTLPYKSRTTIGKTYELIEFIRNGKKIYYFIDDYGDKPIYNEKYFVTLEQWREQQLNKIGIK